jgi:hypothetical protein
VLAEARALVVGAINGSGASGGTSVAAARRSRRGRPRKERATAETVSDFLLKRMSQWGVRRVFGYPGDGINGILAAFTRDTHEIEFVQVRHEEMAA